MASIPPPCWAPLPIGLGAALRSARIDAGLSARALARLVGRSHPWVRDLEDGVRPPSSVMADRISAALQLDPWTDALLWALAVDEVRPGRRTVQ